MEFLQTIQAFVGMAMILGQFVVIVFFVAKIHNQTTHNTERVKELKDVVDDHIKDRDIHRGEVQSVQYSHIEEKMNMLEKRMETMSAAFDELKTIIIERA